MEAFEPVARVAVRDRVRSAVTMCSIVPRLLTSRGMIAGDTVGNVIEGDDQPVTREAAEADVAGDASEVVSP